MALSLFKQTIIAIIWDFDKTLIRGYMQGPLFRYYGVDEDKFWREVDGLPDFHKKRGLELVSGDTLYLNHILTYVRNGIFGGLDNKLLRRLGSELAFYPGLPEFLAKVNDFVASNHPYSSAEVTVEHYIVSTGLRQMILGSKIKDYVDGVWACEFVEAIAPPGYLEPPGQQRLFESEAAATRVVDIGYALDNTTKTRAIFEINKGTNKEPRIDVNAKIREEDRRIPIRNMIHVADGPSDVPVFSVIKQLGGQAYAVYKTGAWDEFAQVRELQMQGRIDAFGPADYTDGSHTSMLILHSVDHVARRIVAERQQMVGERVGSPPGHIVGETPAVKQAEPDQLRLNQP